MDTTPDATPEEDDEEDRFPECPGYEASFLSDLLLCGLLILLPLGLWKALDILIWAIHHIHIHLF